MKKIIFGAMVAAAAVFGAYTASQTSNEVAMNDLQVENIEALGDGGDGSNGYSCPKAIMDFQIHSLKDDWNDEVYRGITCMCTWVTYHTVTNRCD